MNIEISGRHVEVSDPLREYVDKRGVRLFRFFDRIQKVHFIFSRDGDKYSAEIVLSAPKGVKLVAGAKVKEGGLFAALDKVVDKMERQISRYKEKLKDFRRDDIRSALHEKEEIAERAREASEE